MSFPVLKTRLFKPELTGGNPVIEINKRHLIIGIDAVECERAFAEAFERDNLKPYESAVSRFFGGGFQYNIDAVNNAGQRELVSFDKVVDNSPSSEDFAPIIITYLEFSDLL